MFVKVYYPIISGQCIYYQREDDFVYGAWSNPGLQLFIFFY